MLILDLFHHFSDKSRSYLNTDTWSYRKLELIHLRSAE